MTEALLGSNDCIADEVHSRAAAAATSGKARVSRKAMLSQSWDDKESEGSSAQHDSVFGSTMQVNMKSKSSQIELKAAEPLFFIKDHQCVKIDSSL